MEERMEQNIFRNKVIDAFESRGYESILSHVMLDSYKSEYPKDKEFVEEIKEKYRSGE